MELRNIKLDMLLGNPNEIIDEFIQITEGIMIINCDVYNNHGQEFIWYVGDRWIFYQDLKTGDFWCNYYNYWSIFESKFHLNYVDIQFITKFMVETALKNAVGTPPRRLPPNLVFNRLMVGVETALKNAVGTPSCSLTSMAVQLKTALKNALGTLPQSSPSTPAKVETALKNAVGTPLERPAVETDFKNGDTSSYI